MNIQPNTILNFKGNKILVEKVNLTTVIGKWLVNDKFFNMPLNTVKWYIEKGDMKIEHNSQPKTI